MPISANEMMIQDGEGNELGEGEQGEITIRGHNVMQSYDADPDATASAFRNGWFLTGDVGYYRYDGEGRKFFFVAGKK
jgi:long-subunit acyl-CoA synthetase (AMP-forming)